MISIIFPTTKDYVVYKLFNCGLDIDPCLFFVPQMQHGLWGRLFKVIHRRSKSFSVWVVKHWNVPPPIFKLDAPYADLFERHLHPTWNAALSDVLLLLTIHLRYPHRVGNPSILTNPSWSNLLFFCFNSFYDCILLTVKRLSYGLKSLPGRGDKISYLLQSSSNPS